MISGIQRKKEVISSGEISESYMEEWNMLDPKGRMNLGLGVPRNTAWNGMEVRTHRVYVK